MKTLTIVIAAVIAILAAPAVMADFYDDCFNMVKDEISANESMLDEKAQNAIGRCVDLKKSAAPAKEANPNTGNEDMPTWGTVAKTVVLQNAPLAIAGHFNLRYIQRGHQFGHHIIQPYYVQPYYYMYHDPVIRRH